MKNIYIVGGTMGVGKTTVCQLLKKELYNSVLLDGDWCWDSNPFQVTEETKRMVLDNICYLLNSFIRCSVYDNVIFCWVMHEQSIIDSIINRIDNTDCRVKKISLVWHEIALRKRLEKDVKQGIRTKDIVERSIARIPLYEKLETIKIDTSYMAPKDIVKKIIEI